MVKITNLYNVSIAVVILMVLEMVGQTLLRKFFDSGYNMKYWYLPLITWLLYGVACIVLLWGYKYSDISAIETLWDASTSIAVPIIAILFFKGSISFLSGSGILMTIIGIILIVMGSKKKKVLN
jgi:multidrug transporter EmrE-like cation transporter